MHAASWLPTRWSELIARVGSSIDIEASARAHGALRRRRAVRSGADLLHLALLYGPGGLSLRAVCAAAAEAGVAALSDVALLQRLRRSGDFLAAVLAALLSRQAAAGSAGAGLRLCLIDGSSISGPRGTGTDWRLHARYEPACGGFTDLALTDARGAESLARTAAGPRDLLVQDRGYARAGDFRDATARGALVITRIGWRAVKLFERDAQAEVAPAAHGIGPRLDLLGALPRPDDRPCGAAIERAVWIGHGEQAVAARLVIQPIPPEHAARQQRRLRATAARKQCRSDPRSQRAAGFLMLLTTLPAQSFPAERVVALYRLRWQIELAFKRLKSLAGLGTLPASDPALARAWLLAQLIAAVMIETSLRQDLDSPP